MKKITHISKKLLAFVLSLCIVASVLAGIPMISAAGPVFSKEFINNLKENYPLSDGQLYVGYATGSIMPDKSLQLPMGGYGLTSNRIGNRTNTDSKYEMELMTTWVAIMDGEGSIVLFSSNDLIGISTMLAPLRASVLSKVGVSGDRVIASGSHTHSGPDISSTIIEYQDDVNAYIDFFVKQATNTAAEAVRDMRPCDMSVASVECVDNNGNNVLNFVRNYTTSAQDYLGNNIVKTDNHGSWYYNQKSGMWESDSALITGHTTKADATLQMVRFNRSDNNNILMCNFAVHPHRTGSNNGTVFSSDIVGALKKSLAASSIVSSYRVAYHTGGAGNINPASGISGEGIKKTNEYDDVAKKTYTGTVYSTSSGSNSSAQTKYLAAKIWGEEMTKFVEKAFTQNLFQRANGGKVKTRQVGLVGNYHAPEDEATTAAARMIYLIWNSTAYNFKKIVAGTYTYDATYLGYLTTLGYTPQTFTDFMHQVIEEDVPTTSSTTTLRYNGIILKNASLTTGKYAESNIVDSITQTNRNRFVTKMGLAFQQHNDKITKIVQSPYNASNISSRKTNEGKTYTYELDAITIGDVNFSTFPGELFDTNGEFVQDNTPGKMTMVFAYSNGRDGYLPSAYGHLYTCYEADITKTEQGTAEIMAGYTNDLLNDMVYEDETYTMSVGSTKAIKNANGSTLYSYVDNFDYNLGQNYGDSNLSRFKYTTNVNWVTSDPSVATVDQNGVITAVGKGTCKISAIRNNGNALMTVGGVASCYVSVDDHIHCDTCGKVNCTDGGQAVNYTAWTSANSLPTTEGHYYLTKDVNLSSVQTVSSAANVVICLNGHKVTSSNANGAYDVNNANANVKIGDCLDGEGFVSSVSAISDNAAIINVTNGTYSNIGAKINASNVTSANGTAVFVGANGTFNMLGGELLGGTATLGGTVYSEGNLVISGGTIGGGSAVKGGSVSSNGGTFAMIGGTVEGGTVSTAGGAVHINSQNASISGGTISGGEATVEGGCLYVDNGKTFIMNGGTITNGVTARFGGCVSLEYNAVFNMYGGVIENGTTVGKTTNERGGNVYLNGSGTEGAATFNLYDGTVQNGFVYGIGGNFCVPRYTQLNIYGGNIVGGVAEKISSTHGHGGNIFVLGTVRMEDGIVEKGVANSTGGGNFSINGSYSKFIMTGGTIRNGLSKINHRGNVYIWNTAPADAFTMSGGTITDSANFSRPTGFYGGGVYLSGATSGMTISGNAKIKNNIDSFTYNFDLATTTFTYCDLYLETGKTINVGSLSSGASIGVTLGSATSLTSGTSDPFAINGAAYRKYFYSNLPNLYVVKSGSDLALSTDEDTTTDPIPAVSRQGSPTETGTWNRGHNSDGYRHYSIPLSSTLNVSSDFPAGTTFALKGSASTYITLSSAGVITSKTTSGKQLDFVATTPSGEKVDCTVVTGHYHCKECGTFGCKTHTNVLFNPTTTLRSTTGNYYLENDVEVSAVTTYNTSAGNFTLCYNGHQITAENIGVFNVQLGTLNLTDCSDDETGGVTASGVSVGSDINKRSRQTTGIPKCGGGIIFAGNTSSARVNIYGGTLNAYNLRLQNDANVESEQPAGGAVLLYKAKLYMYGGKIIGGIAYRGGAIYSDEATVDISGGIIQDGETADLSKDVTCYGGNIYMLNAASTYLRDGLITNGVVHGIAGNVYMSSGSKTYIYGGKVTDGVALTRSEDNGHGHSGNFFVNGTLYIYGGEISGGVATNSYGGNITLNGPSSKVYMSGGVVKNGLSVKRSTGVGAGNFCVWNQAMENALTITGGTITDDEDFVVPSGYYAGGVRVVSTSTKYTRAVSTSYDNRLVISGNPIIAGNKGYNLCVDNVNYFKIGDGGLTEGANVVITPVEESVICEDVPEASRKYIKCDTQASLGMYYDTSSTDKTPLVTVNAGVYSVAKQFIQDYFTVNGVVQTSVTLDNAIKIASSETYYNSLTATQKQIAESILVENDGDKNVSELISSAKEVVKDADKANEFINTYLKYNGSVITEANAENYKHILSIETTYVALSESVKYYVDKIANTDVSKLIADAKAIDNGYTTNAQKFITDYLTDGSKPITAATDENYDQIISCESVWNTLDAEVKARVNASLGVSVDKLIGDAKIIKSDLDPLAEKFINNYLKIDEEIITSANASNYKQLLSAEAVWNGYSTALKEKIDEKLGASAAALFAAAHSIEQGFISAAQAFINGYLLENGSMITEVTLKNASQVIVSESAFNTLSDDVKSYVDKLVISGGVSGGYAALKANAEKYMNMLDTRAVEIDGGFALFSTVDDPSQYQEVGFFVDLPDIEAQITTYSVYDSVKNNGEDMTSAPSTWSDISTKLFYGTYIIPNREIGKNATVYSYVVLNDGTVVYGIKRNLLLRLDVTFITSDGIGNIGNLDGDDESDFGIV